MHWEPNQDELKINNMCTKIFDGNEYEDMIQLIHN